MNELQPTILRPSDTVLFEYELEIEASDLTSPEGRRLALRLGMQAYGEKLSELLESIVIVDE